MKTLLLQMQSYHAWANDDLLAKLAGIDPVAQAHTVETALRLVNHYHVISRIFRGHLTGVPHGFAGDNTPQTPTLAALSQGLRDIDGWYRDYLTKVTDTDLAEPVAFTFTDGDKGRMTRAEMIAHVILHGGYHRGEVGRLLWGIGQPPPWDTYAVYLHQTQPGRRLA